MPLKHSPVFLQILKVSPFSTFGFVPVLKRCMTDSFLFGWGTILVTTFCGQIRQKIKLSLLEFSLEKSFKRKCRNEELEYLN